MANSRKCVGLMLLAAAGGVALVLALSLPGALLQASSTQPPDAVQAQAQNPLVDATPPESSRLAKEIRDAVVRLPLAAVLGAVLALRPRRRAQGDRSVLVVQTQIMLAVVGAVIMLVVGNSLSRAFGIVGAAGLVRYRSTIDDPKEAVVMLCAVGAGLAAGVGLYVLAPFATVFMAAVLWLVEYFEPAARKQFELTLTMKGVVAFRPKAESVLRGLQMEYELLAENDELVSYSVSAPLNVRTLDISDTLRLLSGDELEIEWKEKRHKRR